MGGGWQRWLPSIFSFLLPPADTLWVCCCLACECVATWPAADGEPSSSSLQSATLRGMPVCPPDPEILIRCVSAAGGLTSWVSATGGLTSWVVAGMIQLPPTMQTSTVGICVG
eukprot:931570-Pelagomonas_calceolata.AAC.6